MTRNTALSLFALLALSPWAANAQEGQDPAPFGYKRDGSGRLLQTHFDLRRRYFTGVQWAGTLHVENDGTFQSATAVEAGGRYELFNDEKSARSRFRYLDTRLQIQELEVDALVFEYTRGRHSPEPLLWVTTFFGEPHRYDIHLAVAPGISLGRMWLGPVNDRRMVALDLIQPHLDWEIFHGASLEDYIAIRLAGGVGLRTFTDNTQTTAYLYPEVGVRSSWLIGDRGLTQLGVNGGLRYSVEPASGVTWWEARFEAPFERVLIAISDQPVGVFVRPSLHVLDLPGDQRIDGRLDAGVRLSLFVPPREADDLCPGEAEDLDYFQDEDGCPDPDNDGDSIVDYRDMCPNEAEDQDGDADEDGCPDF